MANKLPSFIKLPGYYKFEYKPRYYDPKKEEREEKRKRIELKPGGQKEYHSNIAGQLKRQRIVHRRQKVRINNGVRTLSIAGMLSVTTAFYLDYISGPVALGMVAIMIVLFISKMQKV